MSERVIFQGTKAWSSFTSSWLLIFATIAVMVEMHLHPKESWAIIKPFAAVLYKHKILTFQKISKWFYAIDALGVFIILATFVYIWVMRIVWKYIVTEHSAIAQFKFIVSDMKRTIITDEVNTEVSVPVLGGILSWFGVGYGTITISGYSGEDDDVIFKDVANPEQIENIIREIQVGKQSNE